MKRRTVPTSRVNPFVSELEGIRGEGMMVDFSLVSDDYKQGAFTVTVDGAVVADANSISVDALLYALKAGSYLKFKTSGVIVRLTADADEGAESIDVEDVSDAIADGEEAIGDYLGNSDKIIPQGTFMAKLASKKWIPASDTTGSEEPSQVAVGDMHEDLVSNAVNGFGGYRGIGMVNQLCPDRNHPDFNDWKTALGNNFWFKDEADSTESDLS